MAGQGVYDSDGFFEAYQTLRDNPHSLNEVIEKPTMLALLPDLCGKRVLDLGCGCGGHMLHYLRRGAAYVAGIDLAVKMLHRAQTELQKHIENRPHFSAAFSLHRLPLEQLEHFTEADFDVVVSSLAFHYIHDFPALLAKINAKLTQNGTLIFSQEHPITTCHQGGERWEKNAEKIQCAYRLRHYSNEGERARNWFNQAFKTYHRTTATIVNDVIQAGFCLQRLEEPMLAVQPQWQQEFKDLQHRPALLFIKAEKKR